MLLVLVVNTYSYTLYGLLVFEALHTLLLLSNSSLFVFSRVATHREMLGNQPMRLIRKREATSTGQR